MWFDFLITQAVSVCMEISLIKLSFLFFFFIWEKNHDPCKLAVGPFHLSSLTLAPCQIKLRQTVGFCMYNIYMGFVRLTASLKIKEDFNCLIAF